MSRWSSHEASADRRLVHGLNEGDESVLGDLYDAYSEHLFDYVLSMTGDEKVTADVVHDTFIDAYRRAPRMRDHLHLSSWLFGAARRRCLQRGRLTELYWDRAAEFSEDPSGRPEPEPGPEPEPPSSEMLHRLLSATLARMESGDQEVVLLAGRHRLRPSRLGAALGLSPRKAAIRVRQARLSMEDALRAETLIAAQVCAAVQRPVRAVRPAEAETELREHTEGLKGGQNGSPGALNGAYGPRGDKGGKRVNGTSDGAHGVNGTPIAGAVPGHEKAPPDGRRAAPSTVAPAGGRSRSTRGVCKAAGRSLRSAAVVVLAARSPAPAAPAAPPLGRDLPLATTCAPLGGPSADEAVPQDDHDLERHLAGCPACLGRDGLHAVTLLARAPSPVLPAALRHRVMHTATDPELAGHRADIAARGGALTPEGLPSQPDVPSPFTKRWLFTGGGMAGALVSAALAVAMMGPGLGTSVLPWPPFGTRPQPSVTHTSPSEGHAAGKRGGPEERTPPGQVGGPALRPQTEGRKPKVPTTPPGRSPSPPGTPRPPPPGDLVIAPGRVEMYGTKTATIRLTARSGPVTWTAMTSTGQIILSEMQGGMGRDRSDQVTVTLRTALIGLPGQGTVTFTDSEGAIRKVTVVWGASIF